MHESTQLNGTNIVPTPPLPLIVGLQQLIELALVYPVHVRAHTIDQRTGTSLFRKKYQSLLIRTHKHRGSRTTRNVSVPQFLL